MKRIECKYLVPNERLPDLRRMFQPFVEADPHAKKTGGVYTVRSIYFDTPRFTCYHEKIEGLKMRRKLRIRGYNEYQQNAKVFLEIKRRYSIPISKNRCPVPYVDLLPLLESGEVEQYIVPIEKDINRHKDAHRFLYHLKRFSMRPVVNVIYDREAFEGKFDPSVRVTFDKNLRSTLFPSLESLFADTPSKHTFAKHFILEIKYYGDAMPTWARSIVGTLSLKQQALSKYTLSIDAHGPAKHLFGTIGKAQNGFIITAPPSQSKESDLLSNPTRRRVDETSDV